MNARTTTLAIGAIQIVLGLGALVAPEFVMEHVLGFAVRNIDTVNYVRGEVRAIYGGLFTVLGIFTVLGGMDPGANRGRILLLGSCWLGIAAGRLISVVVDGSPGLYGWLAFAFEAAFGAALVACSQVAPERGDVSVPAAEI